MAVRAEFKDIVDALAGQKIVQQLASITSGGKRIATIELVLSPLEPAKSYFVVKGPPSVYSRNRVRNELPNCRSIPDDAQLEIASIANADIAYYKGQDAASAITAYVEISRG